MLNDFIKQNQKTGLRKKTMTLEKCTNLAVWESLKEHSKIINRPENHLKNLLQEENRLEKFSSSIKGFFYDFSRQRVDQKTMEILFELAKARELKQQFNMMASGEKINHSENRAVLHTATRSFSDAPVMVDGINVMPELIEVREKIKNFVKQVETGEIKGSTGKPFEDLVVIGIGGSYLGTEFVSTALKAYTKKNITLHYLANVDIHNFGAVAASVNPEKTLWIVISKSYTTAETMANVNQAEAFMQKKGLDPAKHIVTVTSKGSPGDDPKSPKLSSFHMFDFIGGRYSVTSAVGGVPLGLQLGYDMFERFLKGAELMDIHTQTAPMEENIPLIAALISIWNNNFLGYQTQAVIPYASPLAKLAPHIQQLSMESNGKSVTIEGEPVDQDTGPIIFGEPGTNAQHSFFQLAHQGRPFPVDFIGVIKPQYAQYKEKAKGVTNHQELWANMISQAKALALGKDNDDRARYFSGNRPSSTIIVNDLSPESVGMLLAFYEAKTVYEAFIWGINPFDQFGVELGKTMAGDIRNRMVDKNEAKESGKLDPITEFYIEKLFNQ